MARTRTSKNTSNLRRQWAGYQKKFWDWRQRKFVHRTAHAEVITRMRSEGRLTSRFSFMTIMSCGIAMLGLLLSSPAVVIGAMLISPLMSPIIALGFSLCVLDFRQFKKSLEGILVGLVLALLISMMIVFLSPLTDPTPEIMARTQPNLFDLLVAILSGLAGGYAVIKRKGETIVGVAIATALMPPLAVTGYGIATGNPSIYEGAFFLFMTNLLAIALSVTTLAKWYGFGRRHGHKETLWQSLLILLVFVALSIPLGLSLKNIAYEAYATKILRSAIKDAFQSDKSRLSSFSIAFPKDQPVLVDAVMLTKQYEREAESRIKEALTGKLKRDINLSLDQIVVTSPKATQAEEQDKPDSSLTSPLQLQITKMTQREEVLKSIRNAVFFPTRLIEADLDNNLISIYADNSDDLTLAILRRFEADIAAKFPNWQVKVIPAYQPLPFVFFDVGHSDLNNQQEEQLQHIIWALHRWGIRDVDVVGFASTVGEFDSFNNSSLAYRRARFVADHLSESGIVAQPKAEYRTYKQKRQERDYGIFSLHRVEIRPAYSKAMQMRDKQADEKAAEVEAQAPTTEPALPSPVPQEQKTISEVIQIPQEAETPAETTPAESEASPQ